MEETQPPETSSLVVQAGCCLMCVPDVQLLLRASKWLQCLNGTHTVCCRHYHSALEGSCQDTKNLRVKMFQCVAHVLLPPAMPVHAHMPYADQHSRLANAAQDTELATFTHG
jgi:hypothetical protein